MTEEEKEEVLQIGDTAYKAFVIVMNTATEEEQQFIHNNIDMFLNLFNKAVLTTRKLLQSDIQ